MRSQRIFLGSVAGLLAATAVVVACGSYGMAEPVTVKIDRQVQAALVRDGRLYALTDQGDLVSLDRPKAELKWIGHFDLKPGTLFDVAGGKASLAVQNRVYVIDIAKGKIVAGQVFDQPITSLGFVNQDRLFVVQGGVVQILEAVNAKTISTLALSEPSKRPGLAPMACQVQGDRLYVVATGEKNGLIVVDLQTNKIAEHIAIKNLNLSSGYHGVRDLHIQGDKAYMVCLRFSYGVWTESFGYVDLKTRQFTNLKLPSNLMHESSLAFGPRNSCYLVTGNQAFQYDAKGQLLGAALPKMTGNILTMWNGNAVAAGPQSIEIVPISTKTARSE